MFQEKDEKLDGDAALNKFFREIYSDADEDTRRAMSKSFVRATSLFSREASSGKTLFLHTLFHIRNESWI